MDPLHVVRLAGDALDRCRQRVQQATLGHRGRAGDPLYRARRTLHTGANLLTDKQRTRLEAVFAIDEHVEVEATWGIYQRMIAAYREPDKTKGKAMMRAVIDSVTSGVPAALVEIRRLGRTLKQRATDVLAFFDRPGTSNGPTEAINGRLEHLRGSALGFRNLTNYIARSLLESGGFRPQLHPQLRRATFVSFFKQGCSTMNRKCSPEMRERALRMLAETRPSHPMMISAFCRMAGLLGMSPEMLRLWQRRCEVNAGAKPGLTTDAAAEIKRPQKEVSELRKTNEILKAASTLSSEGTRPPFDQMIRFIIECGGRFGVALICQVLRPAGRGFLTSGGIAPP